MATAIRKIEINQAEKKKFSRTVIDCKTLLFLFQYPTNSPQQQLSMITSEMLLDSKGPRSCARKPDVDVVPLLSRMRPKDQRLKP